MIFDLSQQLDLPTLEALGMKVRLLEKLDRGRKDHPGECRTGGAEIQEIGVALGRMADSKDPSPDSRPTPRQRLDLVDITRL